ncbi:unnamed protein product [marine sediment metagenome]|uniref:Radical SAM core domain-containing protein n=1 Tax=marine sediment metagenome TaxID=412755 RepID=X1JD74_9ZZZZ
MQIGVESGSDRILKLIKKGITVEQILRVNKKLRHAKITPMYSFLIGTPYEHREETIKTMDLVFKLLKDNPDAVTTNLQTYKPFPGTELFDVAVEEFGYMKPCNITDWIDLWNVTFPYDSNVKENHFHPIFQSCHLADQL